MVTVIVIGTGYEFQVPEHMAAEFAKMYPDKAADIASEYPDQAAVIAETLNDREYIPSVVGAVPSATGEIIKRCPDACRSEIFLALLGSEHITDGGDIVAALEGVTLRDSEIEDFIASTPEGYIVEVASELFKRKPTCWPTVITHLSIDNAKEFVGRHRSELGCAKLELDDNNAVVYAMVYPDEAGDVAKRFPELIDDILAVTPRTSACLIAMAVPDKAGNVAKSFPGLVEDILDAALAEQLPTVVEQIFGVFPDLWPTLITRLPQSAALDFLHAHATDISRTSLLVTPPRFGPND